MIKKFLQNLWVKAGTASWWSSLANLSSTIFFYLLILFLPTQLGKHFWPSWSYLYGQRIDYLSPTLFLTDIFVGVLFVLSVVKKEIRVNFTFLLLVLYFGFTVFFSQQPFSGWYYLLKLLEISFVAYFTATQSAHFHRKTLGWLLALGVLFESFLAFVQFYLHSSVGGFLYFVGERNFSSETPGIANASIHGSLVLRPYGTFSHPNVLAGFLLIALLLVWYFLKGETVLWKKNIFLMTILSGSIGILLTLSRVTILVGMGIGVFLIAKKLQKRFIAAFLGVLLSLFFLFPTLLYRFTPSAFEESAAARGELMQASFTVISSHPLFGVGLGNFLQSLPSSSLLQPVHNIFLLWVSETGIIGGALLLGLLAVFGRKIWRVWLSSEKEVRQLLLPLILALVVFMTIGMFDHYFLTLQQGQLLLGFLIGVIFAQLSK